jgi:3-hydroxy-9,10-secoandrosta-1,3,5(10)-triene-9,17-dione monooxygenase
MPRRAGEVFGDGPVACWATLLPKANSVEVPGGYRVSGNFAWGSNSSLSRWVLVAGPVPDRDGQQWFRAHLFPKDDVDIKEGSWDVMGLRATAQHRLFDHGQIRTGIPRF